VDVETRRILEEAVVEASMILKSHRQALDSLADLLCEHETVDGAQIDALLGLKKTQEDVKVSSPAPNGHKPFQIAASINDNNRWSKDNVELDDHLFRWECESGQITQAARRVMDGEESTSQRFVIKHHWSVKNGNL